VIVARFIYNVTTVQKFSTYSKQDVPLTLNTLAHYLVEAWQA